MDGTKMTTFTTQDRQDAQHTPLTDEQIWLLMEEYNLKWSGYTDLVLRFARAIERAHGIGE